MKNRFFRGVLAALLLTFQLPSMAEDTDLFVGSAPASVDMPNVLIVLDNTANWNNAFTNEITALQTVISQLPAGPGDTATFRIGFMLFTESGGSNSGVDGGYVRAAMRPLTEDYQEKLVALLGSLHKLNDKSNGGKLGNTMADVYRYLTGGAPYSGNNKEKADYAGNTFGTGASKDIYSLAGNALAKKDAALYNRPIPAGSCGKTFMIYISNGPAQDNTSDTEAATIVLKSAAGGGTAGNEAAATIPVSPSGSQSNVADEWTRFMKNSNLDLVTYTIEVDRGTSGQAPGWTALLQSMVGTHGGKYFDVKSENLGQAILTAMEDIFSEIQSVNSVFASVSLPVSVNTQGTYLNQVYIGMFRPDHEARPRWYGNLKQYRMAEVNNELKLVDAFEPGDGQIYRSAINSNTGFITECARSFWTPTGLDSYWAFKPTNNCLSVKNSDRSNSPDGNVVDKGAQAFQLRKSTSRPLKTCSPVFKECTSLTAFSDATVTAEMLTPSGATVISTSERDALINWARGQDVNNEHKTDNVLPTPEAAPTTSTVMRPSVHADIVHSRPVALNFGTDDDPQVVVFYGGNDGILRAVNGNRDSLANDDSEHIGNVPPGGEIWSFLAPEFYTQIKRVRENSIKIDFPENNITSHTPLPKPYGMDGTITAYKYDAPNESDSKAWIYATMRRGGRVLYGFNVDVTNLSNITLKWKHGCPNLTDDVDCVKGDTRGDFSGIGQTWSPAKVFTAKGYKDAASVRKPMLIMGGGYDTCEDADVNTCSAEGYSIKGNKVYVLDADTGSLLNTLDTDRSVVADIFVVVDADGIATHAYAADLGGNVYRINMGDAAPGAWTITKIASLGCDNPNVACTANRKFMFAPDVVIKDGINHLMIGSGDREKPIRYYASTSSVTNYFFMLKDKPSDSTWFDREADNCGGLKLLCKASLYGIAFTDGTPTKAQLSTKKGWYLGLRDGEQVVTSGLTIYNVVSFSTHIPAVSVPGSCSSSLGTASIYNIDYRNAASANGTSLRYQTISGGGLPPSPVGGQVILDDGTLTPFCIGCKANSPLEGGNPPTPPTTIQPKARVYWYIEK